MTEKRYTTILTGGRAAVASLLFHTNTSYSFLAIAGQIFNDNTHAPRIGVYVLDDDENVGVVTEHHAA